jgi:hypothetical protein
MPLLSADEPKAWLSAENIAFQQEMIAKLNDGSHDVKAAKMFLRRLEAAHAKHVADRDRLFKELANRSSDFISSGRREGSNGGTGSCEKAAR